MNTVPKITLIAASLTAILGTTTTSALPNTTNSAIVDQAKINVSNQADIQKKQQQALANQQTLSGMVSQYDHELGKATFLWANKNNVTPDVTNIAQEKRNAFVADYYLNQLTGLKTSKASALNSAQLVNLHEPKRGPVIAKYKQSVGGIEVFNREYNVIIDKEYNLVASSGFVSNARVENSAHPALTHFGSPEKAIKIAAQNSGASQQDYQLSNQKAEGKFVSFTAQNDAGQVNAFSPRAKKVFFDNGTNLVAAHYVEVEVSPKDSVESQSYGYVIAADSGKVLFKNNLIAHDSNYTYRVYANQDGYPMEGPHGDVLPKLDTGPDKTEIEQAPLVTISHYSKISTEDPWLPEDATMTSGNNVFAYADVVAPDGFTEGDFSAELTSEKTFDYQLESSQSPTSLNNRKSAIVNLFYMNNFLHNFFYDYGFDEASGNAQESNYGRGGEENDPLHVQAQDYSGLNNANMATPADGRSPRMQQYLWNSKDAIVGTDFAVTVTSHEDIGLLESSKVASFGPVQYDMSGDVVRIDDGTDTVTDGCQDTVNAADVAGKIAIIDRGACAFTIKAEKAQQAGAIGVIIVNNNDDGTPAPMGGSSDLVDVPSMGLSFKDGKKIYDLIDSGEIVTVNLMSTFPLKDSTFDNGIIAHEWGHYISNRLVGNGSGLINFQGRAMGEGWGDFHSLMFIALESDLAIQGNEQFQKPYATGTFVEDFTNGIRRAPYSPVNPLTFKHITSGAEVEGLPPTNGGSPHAAGEVWANMLWNVYIGLINKHGFQEAQDRMATYLVSGYKATPIAPTYVEARDAILASMYATDMEDFTIALKAFADRGLGLGAIAPPRYSEDNSGVVESNKTTLSAFQAQSVTLNTNFNGAELGYCSNDEILDAGETGTIAVSVKNAGSTELSNIKAKVTVSSGHDVTIENDGIIEFDTLAQFSTATSLPIKVTLNEAGIGDQVEFKVTFEGEEIVGETELTTSTVVNYDFKVKAHSGTSAVVDMEGFNLFADFKENVMTGGNLAKGTQGRNTSNTGFFTSVNEGVEFGEQTMFLRNNGFESDVAVETKNFEVGFGDNFSISFWHLYMLEENWDGGVVEISINNGNWVDVTSEIAGGTFDVGYNTNELIENPAQALQNRPVFSGFNIDLETYATAGNVETVNFGDHLNGQTVKFRFRLSSDGGSAETGWFIDQVKFNNVVSSQFHDTIAGNVNACDNVAPIVSAPASVDVNESDTATIAATVTDRDTAELTYSWVQIEGPDATMTGNDTATLSVTPPSITEDTTLKFELTVSDGTSEVKTETVVNVANETETVTPPTLPSSSSNSSGSLGWYALLLAFGGLFRRRK